MENEIFLQALWRKD